MRASRCVLEEHLCAEDWPLRGRKQFFEGDGGKRKRVRSHFLALLCIKQQLCSCCDAWGAREGCGSYQVGVRGKVGR